MTIFIPTTYFIFCLCLIGCGMHCWYTGRRHGIVAAIDSLSEQGYLNDLDDQDSGE